jgi:hypothetical protein
VISDRWMNDAPPPFRRALHSAFLARTHVDADDRRRYHVRKDATPGEACSTLWKLRELLVVPRLKRSRGRARFSALYPIDRFPICRSDIPNAAPLRPGCIKLPGYPHSSRRDKGYLPYVHAYPRLPAPMPSLAKRQSLSRKRKSWLDQRGNGFWGPIEPANKRYEKLIPIQQVF